ncbi:MAG: hypothetical protein II738_05760, partial [Clostridia bacterium]|nr:hypothetical protein [Clostridia bacterium]
TALHGRLCGNETFAFGKAISLENVDAYRSKCVIIKSQKKVVVISRSPENSMDLLEAVGGPADVVIFAGAPSPVAGTLPRGIVSGGAETALSVETAAVREHSEHFAVTAEDGAITVYL